MLYRRCLADWLGELCGGKAGPSNKTECERPQNLKQRMDRQLKAVYYSLCLFSYAIMFLKKCDLSLPERTELQ